MIKREIHRSVLIVAKSRAIIDSIKSILTSTDLYFEFIEAENVNKGFTKYKKKKKWTMVFMEWELGAEGKNDLPNVIRKNDSLIPIMFLSSEFKHFPKETDVDFFMTLPLNRDDFINKVQCILKMKSNTEEISKELSYILSFFDIVPKVFNMELGLEIETVGHPYLKNDSQSSQFEYSTLVTLGGDVNGHSILSLPKNLSEILLKKFLGVDDLSINKVLEAVGEFNNIICGLALNNINDIYNINGSVCPPVGIFGSQYGVQVVDDAHCGVCEFKVLDETFKLEVNLYIKKLLLVS